VLAVGRSSVVLGMSVMLPFAVLFAVVLFHLFPQSSAPAVLFPEHPVPGGFAMAMYTVMWNYLGWDNASTVAEEVHRPVRSYMIGMVSAFALIVAGYLLSTFAALRSGIAPAVLEEQGFPALGFAAGGVWLGSLMAAGGMASALGLFLSILCAVSRLPKVMADDGLLPAMFSRMTHRSAVPHVSLVVCALIVSGMILWGFSNLLIIDVTLYGSALMLEFVALCVLRFRHPESHRPFRIPLPLSGVVVMAALPALCLVVAFAAIITSASTHANAALFAVAAVATGPLLWTFRRKFKELLQFKNTTG
jgi:amino acid transporter